MTVSGPSLRWWRRAGFWPLIVLTTINIFNYIDRFVITAVLPAIRDDLQLSYAEGGMLGTAFIVVYAATSPLFGWLGDRGVRKRWVAVGVGLWSLATGMAGFARGFGTLFAARSVVGVGEAAYGTISPSLIADYFPKVMRGRVMSVFFLAIPVGSALGYLLGGVLGKSFGWRAAFFVVGFPGLLLALATLFLSEPSRGAQDDESDSRPVSQTLRETYLELARNPLYLWTVLGYTAYTFAIGGLAFWTPSYMIEVRHFESDQGMILFGGITVVTGIVGTLVGGWLGDRLLRITPKAYTWLGVWAMGAGATLALLAIFARDRFWFLALLGLAEVFLFLNTGPINALIVNAVRPAIRATAVAASILVIHVLGDAISPFVIGAISDRHSLHYGMMAIPLVFLLAGGLWAVSLKARLPRDGRREGAAAGVD